MNKVQIVFLLSSPWPSKYFNAFLDLHDRVAAAGFHTSVATDPAHLCRPSGRLRIAVVDGNDDAHHFDAFRLLRMLRSESDLCAIVFLTDRHHRGQAREAGADVCLSSKVDDARLCDVLRKLAHKCMVLSSP